MRQHLLLLLIILLSNSIFSQENGKEKTLTYKDNISWIESFNKVEKLSEKIELVKERIRNDTLIYSPDTCKIKIQITNDSVKTLNETECYYKIKFILNVRNSAYFLDILKYPRQRNIIEFLKESNISEVKTLWGVEAIKIYGSTARYGVVILKSDSRDLKKKIKNVL